MVNGELRVRHDDLIHNVRIWVDQVKITDTTDVPTNKCTPTDITLTKEQEDGLRGVLEIVERQIIDIMAGTPKPNKSPAVNPNKTSDYARVHLNVTMPLVLTIEPDLWEGKPDEYRQMVVLALHEMIQNSRLGILQGKVKINETARFNLQ